MFWGFVIESEIPVVAVIHIEYSVVALNVHSIGDYYAHLVLRLGLALPILFSSLLFVLSTFLFVTRVAIGAITASVTRPARGSSSIARS